MEQPISELAGTTDSATGADAGIAEAASEPIGISGEAGPAAAPPADGDAIAPDATAADEQPATQWEVPAEEPAAQPWEAPAAVPAAGSWGEPAADAPWAEPAATATPADDALRGKDEEIARIQAQLIERDSIAGGLSSRVAQQEESINTIQAQLIAKDGQIRELTERAADISGQFQRLSADFDNFRRRAGQERDNLVKFAGEGVLTDLLPIFDNFGRAMQAANAIDTDPVIKGLEAMINQIKGLDMIRRQLDALMQKKGVSVIPTVGETFDPNLHEAVMMEESTEHPDQAIIGELQSGYTLSGKVLRPAMVKVASNPAGVAPPVAPAAEPAAQPWDAPAAGAEAAPAAAPPTADAVEPVGISGEAGPVGISGGAGPAAEPQAGGWDQISDDLGSIDLKVENVPGEES